MRLKDRVAIVTGGGSGMGKAISLGLAQEGANVVVAARTLDRLERVAGEIRSMGRRALAIQTDIRQWEQVDSMARKTMDEFGRIDILVNNAAVHLPASFLDISEEDWFQTMDTVIHGTYRCCVHASKVMVAQRRGVIVNVLCPHAQIGYPWVHLGTAKAFQSMFTKGLAADLAPYGIRVNGVCPGLVPTEGMLAATDPVRFKELAEVGLGPLGRSCQPEDVAGAVNFIASDEAAYMTGAVLNVDGGITGFVLGHRRWIPSTATAATR